MSETIYRTYPESRLRQALKELASRIRLTESNLERAYARQQQAQAATDRVQRLLSRAQGELRLVEALLNEKETFFEEEEEEDSQESNQRSRGTVLSSCSAPNSPRAGTAATAGPASPTFLLRGLSR